MAKLSSKEIILKSINMEKTPRLPVALLSGGAWTFNRKGLSLEQALKREPEELAELIVETNELVESDIVWPGAGYHNLAIGALGGNIKFRAKGTPDVMEPFLTTPSDAEKVNFDRLADDEGLKMLWETAGIVSRTIGDGILVGASQWGPFTLAGLVYGVDNLMRNIYKDKGAVHEILEFSTELCFRYLEPYIEAGVGIISVADPSSSGNLISRRHFKEFSLPYLKKVVSKIKQKGAFVSIHICGNITNRLDLIPESGAKVISVDYKVDIGKAKELVGSKMAFAGNLNPVGIMKDETPQGVAAACRACIKKAEGISNYIVMPGCDIPPTVPLENIRVMVETAKNWES